MSNELARPGEGALGTRGQILSLLRDYGPLTRIEVSRRTALSPTTITRVVGQLLEDGCVVEGGTVSPRRTGRPGTELSIVPNARRVIGVQVGVGTVRVGLVDLLGSCDALDGFDYPVDADVLKVLDQVAETVVRVRERAGIPAHHILGVGVAVPGPVDQQMRRLLMPINLPWRDVPIADHLEADLGLPVVVDHNVRSMALAEARFGVGRGAGSVAFVYLRTGIGAGLVVSGQGFQGGVHGALEIGHLRVSLAGEKCVCGGNGCLETVVSERALRTRVERLGLEAKGREPLQVLVDAAADGGPAADDLDALIGHLATGLSAMVNLLTPEVIVLGGAFCSLPDSFLDRLTDAVREAAFPIIRPAVHLRRSLLGMDAGVHGAATVALDHFFYA